MGLGLLGVLFDDWQDALGFEGFVDEESAFLGPVGVDAGAASVVDDVGCGVGVAVPGVLLVEQPGARLLVLDS